MSKYDEIGTAEALVREVISNGLSLDQDDRNRAADIVGRTSVGELAALANSEEKASGKQFGETLYFILFNIWNWREATSFYNEHTLAVAVKFRELKAERDELSKDREAAWEKVNELQEKWDSTYEQFRRHENRAIAAEQEIVVLKAKLYDLMVAGT